MTRTQRALALFATAVSACSSPLTIADDESLAPLPPAVPSPADNASSAAKVTVGRLLFWDPILSGDRRVACATCHDPRLGYADGLAQSIGVGGSGRGRERSGPPDSFTPRNSMTIVNTGFNGLHFDALAAEEAPMFWDNRSRSLEEQALEPILSEVEMRGERISEEQILDEIVDRVAATPEYVDLFDAAFDGAAVDATRIAQALASFERSLVARDSSFDRYMRGDDQALSSQQKRGLLSLINSGCTRCHSGPMFSDFKRHRIGVSGETASPGGMRTPSLRLVTVTAPYMHAGSMATLEEVFEHYDNVDENLDPMLVDIEPPDGADKEDLISFLEAISDGNLDTAEPATVPSGLQVGGFD